MGSQCSNTCNDFMVDNEQYDQGLAALQAGRLQPQVKIISDKISKNRLEAEFPKFPSHIQSRIEKLSKYYRQTATVSSSEQNLTPRKIYRCKSPFNFVYINLQDRPQPYPIGKCIICKLKERDEFAGYFQGTLNENFVISPKDCVIIFSNGCYFEGISEIEGRYTNENTGLKYEGGWGNEMPEKYGKQKNNKGSYEGEYQNGEKQGQGKFTWNLGAIYEGNFTKGSFNGQGRLIDQNQHYEYEGQFKKGEKHGKGTEQTKTQKYEGEFQYGFRNGFGKLEVFKDQQKSQLVKIYQGEFNLNEPHGKGQLVIIKNGSEKDTIKGLWTKGKITAILSQN